MKKSVIKSLKAIINYIVIKSSNLNEDVAKIILWYMSVILCGTYSITNKLNTGEVIDIMVVFINIDFFWYTSNASISIKVYSKLLYKFHI